MAGGPMSDPAKMIATIKTITIMRVIRTALCIHKLLSWGYLIVYGKTCGKLFSAGFTVYGAL